MTGPQFPATLGRLPLHYQPGTMWDYSFGLEVTGLAVEAVTKQRLGQFLQERLFGPLGMLDTSFAVPSAKAARIARPLPLDPETGMPPSFRDPVKPWQFDCGGGCASGTAIDYTRFALMLLDKGALGGTRLLSRKTVEDMTADQLGADVNTERLDNFPVEHIAGYGFGLGVAVRRQSGVAGVPGTPGEFLVERCTRHDVLGVDPKEELTVVYLAKTPSDPPALSRNDQDTRASGDRRLSAQGGSRQPPPSRVASRPDKAALTRRSAPTDRPGGARSAVASAKAEGPRRQSRGVFRCRSARERAPQI